MVSAPKIANTDRKPSVIATVTAAARATATGRPGLESLMTKVRYAGSSANPHGLSAATSPAANASPSSSWFTRGYLSAQRGYAAGQILLGHGGGRVVDEGGRSVRFDEEVGGLPGDIEPGPQRAVGVVEVGEVQVVPRYEALHRADIGAPRDTDEGHLRVGGRDLADIRRLLVAERAPRRPEPQYGRLAPQSRTVERRAAERRSSEVERIVGAGGRRVEHR